MSGATEDSTSDSAQALLKKAFNTLNINLLQEALSKGADVNSRNESDEPLFEDVLFFPYDEEDQRTWDKENICRFVKICCEHGLDLNASYYDKLDETTYYMKEIILKYGCHMDIDFVKFLFDCGMDTLTPKWDDKTLLDEIMDYVDAERMSGYPAFAQWYAKVSLFLISQGCKTGKGEDVPLDRIHYLEQESQGIDVAAKERRANGKKESRIKPIRTTSFNPDEHKRLLEILRDAWVTLDATELVKHISLDFQYDSQWVFSNMDAEEYPSYIKGKFAAIKKTGAFPSVSLVNDPHFSGDMLKLEQQGNPPGYLRIRCSEGLIYKMDMCMF